MLEVLNDDVSSACVQSCERTEQGAVAAKPYRAFQSGRAVGAPLPRAVALRAAQVIRRRSGAASQLKYSRWSPIAIEELQQGAQQVCLHRRGK